jgi:hypothetical protein
VLGGCVQRDADSSAAPGCDAYLDCLAAIDVDMFESELLVYGREGSCLQQSAPNTCNEVCLERLDDIGSSGQTRELQPEDCVLDGDTWRPVAGFDIGSNEVVPMTSWAPADHATHQDPGGTGCQTFAGGQNEAFSDCVANLTVADQRGFCMALGPGQACPGDDPSYLDACEQINMGLIPPPA